MIMTRIGCYPYLLTQFKSCCPCLLLGCEPVETFRILSASLAADRDCRVSDETLVRQMFALAKDPARTDDEAVVSDLNPLEK